MIRKYLVLVVPFILLGCGNSIIIKGKIDGIKEMVGEVKMISLKGKEKTLGPVHFKNGKFRFKVENVVPPLNLTFCINDSTQFDFWIDSYGSQSLSGVIENSEYKLKQGSFGAEVGKHTTQLYEMYISPIKAKEDSIKYYQSQLDNKKKLTDVQFDQWKKYENDISRAYRRRRKAVMLNVRKNPNNTIALGLIYNHYNQLKPKHQEEALKYVNGYFGYCGLGWQIMN